MEYILKIVLLGDAGVGKTSLVYRFIENRFSTDFKSTLGVNLLKRTIEIDGNQVTTQIWDLGGQEAYKKLRKLYLEGASGALVVYDVTSESSFQNLNEWINSFKETRTECPIVLIGNKTDLSQLRKVTQDQAKTYAKEKNILDFIETSAKTGENVEVAFKNLIRKAMLKGS
ncbi:MAG: small GTP-binding protein [Promethearchaeota archaeon CR_4]|nr:MAG: small GTP-binding protein [Candidatus Lokiarchaeota archaeon CR_4]